MTINLHLPPKNEVLKPTITVFGVGGAGGNAVNNMIASNLQGVNFVVANTDAQALERSSCERRIQLGVNVTRGLGAGASPDVGRDAAEEVIDEIAEHMEGSNMVFITAGMGGGTGTGAAPVIARMAREQGVLTVGVVTKPFHFEGTHRMRLADYGLEELQKYVDTLIVIPNQNLFRVANERTTFADAFKMADEVLHSGVRGVTDLMIMPGLINLDFADIRAVMREMGKAMMGTGEAVGDNRAIEAAEAAISNPLLDDVSMKGARGVLINITGGMDMTLFEVDEAANRIRQEVDEDANIIFGSTFSDALDGRMRVSVVATGIEAVENSQRPPFVASGTAQHAAPRQQQAAPAKSYATRALDVMSARPAATAPASITKAAATPTPAAPATWAPAAAAPVAAPAASAAGAASAPAAAPAPAPLPAKTTVAPATSGIPKFTRSRVQSSAEVKEPSLFESVMEDKVLLVEEEEVSELTLEMDAPEVQEEAPVAKAEEVALPVEPSFVPPKAAQPTQRSHYVSRPMDEGRVAGRASREEAADAKAEGKRGMNFFQRMAGKGEKAEAAPAQPERRVEVTDTRQPAAQLVAERKPAAGGSEEDYLDIPAFLRRQAN